MMTVITRQFTKDILSSTLFALIALVALFAFFDLVGQLDSIGNGRTLADAFLLTGLSLPGRIYQVMPLAALLSSIYIMSRWAASSEFTVLRVAGLSPLRLCMSLSVSAVILVGTTYVFGEFLAPPAEKYAVEVKTLSKSQNLMARGYSTGVWLRDVAVVDNQTLNRYINVSYIRADNNRETGAWRVFEFSDKGFLLRMISSKTASYSTDEGWTLHNVEISTYPVVPRGEEADVKGLEVKRTTEKSLVFSSTLGPDMLSVFTSRPDDMSLRDLSRMITHLQANSQDSEKQEIAFWTKLFYPLSTLVMMTLSMPFAYMNARSGGMAIKMFAGIMIGITFYALSNIFSYLGSTTMLTPMWAALAPTLGMLVAGAIAMLFVERR